MENATLKTIKGRRSILRFEDAPIEDEKIAAILEAGRWAPSYANSQPWEFIVVKDPQVKQQLGELVQRIAIARRGRVAITGRGVGDAPVVIVVSVNPEVDPNHYIEAGAVATQNIALAAHSLGLASYWAGVFNLKGAKGSPEEQIKQLLNIPKKHRVVALLPIGTPAYQEEKERKGLDEMVYYDQYGKEWAQLYELMGRRKKGK